MASSLNKLVDSLVKQGSQKSQVAAAAEKDNAKSAVGTVLPHWIFEGAKVSYYSPRSEQALDVIVDKISHSQQQVRFIFEADKNAWKVTTFAQILAGSSPLRQRPQRQRQQRRQQQREAAAATGKLGSAGEGERDKDESESFLEKMEQKFGAADARRDSGPSLGPALSRMPQAWAEKEVVDLEAAAPQPTTVDLASNSGSSDEGGERARAQENPDPYGLGEVATAAAVPSVPADPARSAAAVAALSGGRQAGRPSLRSGARRRRASSPRGNREGSSPSRAAVSQADSRREAGGRKSGREDAAGSGRGRRGGPRSSSESGGRGRSRGGRSRSGRRRRSRERSQKHRRR